MSRTTATTEVLTAATVKRHGLEPAMEVIAAGEFEREELFDPSPEIDSVLEYLLTLPQTVERDESIARLRRALRLNECQSVEARIISGFTDELARRCREDELAGVSAAITAKAVARRLREPLAMIASPLLFGTDALIDASQIIGEAIGKVPSAQLLSPEGAHQLGAERFELLVRISQTKKGAAGDQPATPETPRGGVELERD